MSVAGRPTPAPPIKVLYLLGKGRAGGTLLNNLLGQIPGMAAPGEMSRLWTWGLTEGWKCGCGLSVRGCPFWKDVIDELGVRDQDVPDIVAAQNEIMRWKTVSRLLRTKRTGLGTWPALDSYVELQARLYRAVAKVANVDVIVDSTRWPTAPLALGLVPGTDVYVVHLIRDPRAVIYSWRRRKLLVDRPGNPEMQTFGPYYTMTSWWARTLLADVVMRRRDPSRRRSLRYEDLMANPKVGVGDVASWVLGKPADVDFIDDGSARMEATHTVGGNPSRLATGTVELRQDDEWISKQPRKDWMVGTVLGLPLLMRFRYPIIRRKR